MRCDGQTNIPCNHQSQTTIIINKIQNIRKMNLLRRKVIEELTLTKRLLSTSRICLHEDVSSHKPQTSRTIPSDGLTLADFTSSSSSSSSSRSHLSSTTTNTPPHPRSVYIETYGCQMNINDTELLSSILADSGYTQTASSATANVVLLNTCAIREHAESKIWNRLLHLRGEKSKRSKNSSPMVVGVLGCMAERLKERLLEKEKLVDIVAGPDAYRDLPRLIDIVAGGEASSAMNVQLSVDETYADIVPLRKQGATSAFVSISRGCNNLCSFCIVPYTRGRERSRPMQTIVDEVESLVDQGVKEVTLLGQNVNSYSYLPTSNSLEDQNTAIHSSRRSERGDDNKTDAFSRWYAPGFTSVYRPNRQGKLGFAHLLDAVASVDQELRIRFTSPHPKDFTQDVLDVISAHHNICKQLHVPAQSGSTAMLAAMRRGHSREAYDNLIRRVQTTLPLGTALSTDMITGFCGESDADHEESVDLMKKVQYEQAFIFAYSDRERTHAARHLVDDVPREVKIQRLQELNEVYRAGRLVKYQEQIGKYHLVLVEGPARLKKLEPLLVAKYGTGNNSDGAAHNNNNNEMLTGRTDNFMRVIFDDIPVPLQYRSTTTNNSTMVRLQPGDYVAVKVEAATGGKLYAIPLARTTMAEFVTIQGSALPKE